MSKFFQCSFMFLSFITCLQAQNSYLYVGGDIGGNALMIQSSEDSNWVGGPGVVNTNYSKMGFFGGLVFGYTKTFTSISFGLNTGITYLNEQAKHTTEGVFSGSSYHEIDRIKLKYFYDFMAYFGYLLTDTAEVYVEVGPANGNFSFAQSYKFTTQTTPFTSVNNKSLWGINSGIGLKEKLTKNFFINVGLNYLDFRSYSVQEIHGHTLDKKHYEPSMLTGKVGIEYRI